MLSVECNEPELNCSCKFDEKNEKFKPKRNHKCVQAWIELMNSDYRDYIIELEWPDVNIGTFWLHEDDEMFNLNTCVEFMAELKSAKIGSRLYASIATVSTGKNQYAHFNGIFVNKTNTKLSICHFDPGFNRWDAMTRSIKATLEALLWKQLKEEGNKLSIRNVNLPLQKLTGDSFCQTWTSAFLHDVWSFGLNKTISMYNSLNTKEKATVFIKYSILWFLSKNKQLREGLEFGLVKKLGLNKTNKMSVLAALQCFCHQIDKAYF